jgi:signal peptidase I
MASLRASTGALHRIVDALLVALVLVVLQALILSRVVPMTGRQTLVIAGGSMEPAIPLGAAIVVEPVGTSQLAIGDVVSMRVGPERTVFTHRITRLISRADGLWIETKGDANASVDPSIVPASAVIGRQVVTIPFAGYVIKFLSIPSGILFVLCLAGILIATGWLLDAVALAQPRAVRVRATFGNGRLGPKLGRRTATRTGTPPAARPRLVRSTVGPPLAQEDPMRPRRARWAAEHRNPGPATDGTGALGV